MHAQRVRGLCATRNREIRTAELKFAHEKAQPNPDVVGRSVVSLPSVSGSSGPTKWLKEFLESQNFLK